MKTKHLFIAITLIYVLMRPGSFASRPDRVIPDPLQTYFRHRAARQPSISKSQTLLGSVVPERRGKIPPSAMDPMELP